MVVGVVMVGNRGIESLIVAYPERMEAYANHGALYSLLESRAQDGKSRNDLGLPIPAADRMETSGDYRRRYLAVSVYTSWGLGVVRIHSFMVGPRGNSKQCVHFVSPVRGPELQGG
jgi:hypothetical protein